MADDSRTHDPVDEFVAELRRSSDDADYAAKVIDSSWALEVGIAANNLDRAADWIEASVGGGALCASCGVPWLACPHPIDDRVEVSAQLSRAPAGLRVARNEWDTPERPHILRVGFDWVPVTDEVADWIEEALGASRACSICGPAGQCDCVETGR